jgi:hypothetical protein
MLLGAFVFIALQAGFAYSQDTNEITVISPNSAAQGTTNLLVTFTLDTDSPPAPPASVVPQSVAIGTLNGTSVSHVSQYSVTARFNIPSGESVGTKNATITFTIPNGALIFSMENGFTVISGANMPSSVTQNPQSQTTTPGGLVIFSVSASGTAPLRYRWQKNASDIDNADSSSYMISPVAFSDSGNYRCIVTNDFGSDTSNEARLTVRELPTNNYPVVDTGQDSCYNNSMGIVCPDSVQTFYGQDSQHSGHAPHYMLSGDGLTVLDNVTGLTWQRNPDINGDGQIRATDKLTWADFQLYPATLNSANFGGFNDWRMPTIKELYSLIKFNGTDPSNGGTIGLIPFIDTEYFPFAYGDTLAGERIIDAQYASGTMYVNHVYGDLLLDLLFGVNFADGRIKGYGLIIPGGVEKTFFVKCVRGNTDYGINNFVSNGDSTISDRSTGLTWSQMDSRSAMNWQSALTWVQTQNAQNYLGHSGWRLPDVKELQSIVDYTRAPDVTNSPAINPLFLTTSITNEAGQTDYPYFWASTTHVSQGTIPGAAATYVAFGRAMGYMNSAWYDVHGAGAQRSDPKEGNPADYPYGHGPQGDAIHIFNYVRLVRSGMELRANEHTDLQPTNYGITCFPNPFNPTTAIAYDLPQAGHISLIVYDLLGREVVVLQDGFVEAGAHRATFSGNNLASGIYFARLDAGSVSRTKKLMLLK